MHVKADAEIFQQIPLFTGCDKAHLQILAFSSIRVQLPENRLLFKKGVQGGAGFVILEGTAEVYDDALGAANPVASIEGRAFLGELSMITNAAYPVTVRTKSALAAQRIERDLFLRVAAEFPEFALRVLNNLSAKLGKSVADLKEVKRLFE